jgi:hypothetical protein
LAGFGLTAIFLLILESCVDLTGPVLHSHAPSFESTLVLPAVLFSAIIGLGLSLGNIRRPRSLSLLGRVAALLTAAFAMSALVMVMLLSWLDFAARGEGDRMPQLLGSETFQAFISTHPPDTPFGIGFWATLTPFATAALICCLLLLRTWAKPEFDLTQHLSLLLLAVAAPCGAFLFGSMLAEERVPQGFIGGSEIAFPMLPVVVLGALGGFVASRLRPTPQSHKQPKSTDRKADIGKALTSASQLSVLALILLYLSVSQISSYASRVRELIQLREAFASDVLQQYAPTDDALDNVPSVAWANNITISQYSGSDLFGELKDRHDHPYKVAVEESLSREKWSARVWRSKYKINRTLLIADREGVSYLATDSPISIYPKIEAQLRAQSVALPDVGFSLDLSSFTIVAPFVIFAVLVLLSERARVVIDNFSPPDDPWVLLDGRTGLQGVLARLWLAAIAIGPWVLAVTVVEVLALLLRSKGDFETYALDGIASVYVGLILALLMVSTCSAVRRLLFMRALFRTAN